MIEENIYYENTIAERVNDILKDKFSLNQTISTLNIQRE